MIDEAKKEIKNEIEDLFKNAIGDRINNYQLKD